MYFVPIAYIARKQDNLLAALKFVRIWAHPAAIRPDRAIRLNKFSPGGIPPGENLYRSYPLRGRFSRADKPANVKFY
jgi:hypothetical protein